jgi:hypothetical protein
MDQAGIKHYVPVPPNPLPGLISVALGLRPTCRAGDLSALANSNVDMEGEFFLVKLHAADIPRFLQSKRPRYHLRHHVYVFHLASPVAYFTSSTISGVEPEFL